MVKKRTRLYNWLADIAFCLLMFLVIIKILYPVKPDANVMHGLKYYFLLLNALYYLCCEFFFGRTIGKLLTKTKVVNDNNLNVGFGSALIRTAVRYIPLEPFCLFFNVDNETLHDTLSNTQLIYTINKNP